MNAREKNVYSYMVALSRLYGVVEWKQFVAVFNRYNTPKITKKEIMDTPAYWEKRETYCALYADMLVSTMAPDDVVLNAVGYAKGKEYYFPTEEEILALSKPKEYYEKSPAHLVLYDAMRNILRWGRPKGADIEELLKKLCVSLGLMIGSETPRQKIFDMLSKNGVEVFELADTQKFLDKLMNAWNNTRMWANRGFTPNEMMAKMPKEDISIKEDTSKKEIRIMTGSKPFDLTRDTAVKFYKLWYLLTHGINEKYKIVPPYPLPVYGERVDETPIITVREKLWESPGYITEFLISAAAGSLSVWERRSLEDWRDKFMKGCFVIHDTCRIIRCFSRLTVNVIRISYTPYTGLPTVSRMRCAGGKPRLSSTRCFYPLTGRLFTTAC